MGAKKNDYSGLFNNIQKQVETAEENGQPITDLIKQQIDLLKLSHDEFIKSAQEDGYELTNPKLGEIEIGQYTAMKQLAQKINLPTDEYDELIKNVKIRIFGEENYKRFFEQN